MNRVSIFNYPTYFLRYRYRVVPLFPYIPIILCTGYSERISKDKAHQIGIKEFVLKPIIMSDMAKTVRNVLDERTP